MGIDRDAFLKASFKRQPVEIEGLGVVYVREVTAAEADEYARKEQAKNKDELANITWLTIRVLCDDQGNALLTDADAQAVKVLPLRYLKDIGKVAAEISGWAKSDGADAEDDAKKDVSA
jgi:hypothetical protein